MELQLPWGSLSLNLTLPFDLFSTEKVLYYDLPFEVFISLPSTFILKFPHKITKKGCGVKCCSIRRVFRIGNGKCQINTGVSKIWKYDVCVSPDVCSICQFMVLCQHWLKFKLTICRFLRRTLAIFLNFVRSCHMTEDFVFWHSIYLIPSGSAIWSYLCFRAFSSPETIIRTPTTTMSRGHHPFNP